MAKMTGKKKVRARKRSQTLASTGASTGASTASLTTELRPEETMAGREQSQAQGHALAVHSEQTVLEEFFTTIEDAAINRYADAASTVLESQELSDKNAYLSCLLGEEEYGIDLNMAREILRKIQLTAVPHAPDAVLGVMSLRGQVMPVIDLAMRLGLVEQKGPEKRGQRYIVLSYGGELLCFRVDGVDGVVAFDDASIEPPPQDLHGLGRDYVFGIGRAGNDRMLLLLDLDLAVGELLPGEQ